MDEVRPEPVDVTDIIAKLFDRLFDRLGHRWRSER
jgi:hypothetical protein